MSYDSKCHELAELFLSDEKLTGLQQAKATRLLAQEIQNCIEAWLTYDLRYLKQEQQPASKP